MCVFVQTGSKVMQKFICGPSYLLLLHFYVLSSRPMKCARKFEDSRTDQWEAVFSFVRDLLIGEVLLSFAT